MYTDTAGQMTTSPTESLKWKSDRPAGQRIDGDRERRPRVQHRPRRARPATVTDTSRGATDPGMPMSGACPRMVPAMARWPVGSSPHS